jgi:glycosyltransferase involved in cell wall biosynthesis
MATPQIQPLGGRDRESRRQLTVVVPAYNEEAQIGATIDALREIEPQLARRGLALKIYVINDGSSDRTAAVAEAHGVDRILRHQVNRGLGAAVRTGLNAARSDHVDVLVKFDADLQHDPVDILALIEPILNDEADIVFGSRFERIEYRMPLVRRVGNRVFTRLMRWLTGWDVRDSQPGIFAISATYLEVFRIPGDYNYTQQILLDAYHKGMRFAQAPVRFRKRETGTSFVSARYPFVVLQQLLMVLVGVKPMKVFAPIGGVFLLLGTVVFSYEIVQYMVGLASKPVGNVNLVLGSVLFGVQTLFFGILAQLIIERRD